MHIGLVDLQWEGHHTPYVVYLSRYFTQEGHEVTFITQAENPRLDALPDAEGLTVRAVDSPTSSDDTPDGFLASVGDQIYRVMQLRQIYKIAQKKDIDLVHLLYFDRTQIPLYITGKLSSKELPPTVATLHRDAFLDNNNRPLSKAAIQAATKWALHSTLRDGTLDCLTVHANSIRDRIIGAVPAATRENTRMIPAPTPELSVGLTTAEAREHLGLPQGEPIYLFFGGLRYEKGPDILSEALQDVDTEMTVVYAGKAIDFNQSDVNEWKGRTPGHVTIEDRIEFIPEDEVDHYFVAADALVLPYRRERGISGPLRRAAWASTPVVGNRQSDIGDIIQTESLGPTFKNREELSDILSYSIIQDIDSRGRALSEFARSQHWEQTGELLMNIYRSIGIRGVNGDVRE